jgi:DNA invertase Pin-like site-specific DNA recombinase
MATFGYIQGSIDPRIEIGDLQEQTIRRYCARAGLSFDGVYADCADDGKRTLFDCPAGKRLLVNLRRGHILVLARIDVLSRSSAGFGREIERLGNLGVTVHLCGRPCYILNPKSPMSLFLIEFLSRYADRERRTKSVLNLEAAYRARVEGRRRSRSAPYGYKWVRRGTKM